MSEQELLRLENMPVYQNKMFDSPAEAKACPRGDVVISQDASSGLVRNVAFDPRKLDYDKSYQNEQGHSTIFQEHLSDVLSVLGRYFSSARILEVGCGKGAFLCQLREAGYDAWGVDPAYEGTEPYIVKAEFSPELNLRREAIVMRHVLEHIPQPKEFLDAVMRANGNSGLIYIEVPCLDWILRTHAWFDVFYEHVNYFRLSDFDALFGNVIESGHLFGGQYLYVVADLATLRDPVQRLGTAIVSFPSDFFDSIAKCIDAGTTASDSSLWGCGAKGVMFAHHLGQRGLEMNFAIDINPAKQGRFLASSGIPVFSPEHGLARLKKGADIFVMNSNYLDEIKFVGGRDFNYIQVDAL